jgi:hypothetical protein
MAGGTRKAPKGGITFLLFGTTLFWCLLQQHITAGLRRGGCGKGEHPPALHDGLLWLISPLQVLLYLSFADAGAQGAGDRTMGGPWHHAACVSLHMTP